MSDEIKEEKKSFLQKVPGFRSGKMWKKYVAGFVYAFIFMIICIAIIDPSSDEPNEQAGTSNTDSITVTEEQKQAILSFEQELYDIEKIATQAMQAYQDKANGLSDGSANIFDTYSAASNAKEKCDIVRRSYYEAEIPEGLPKKIEESLKEAKSELSTAYMVKAEAMEAAMAFLDNQKPSDLQKYKDEMSNADIFIMNGVLKITEAKQIAGIELE